MQLYEQQQLKVQNSLTGKKELFTSLNPGYIGMYVCGPTVYSNVHLGNCRTFMSFDMIFRYLRHLGYKVRYVRNITDAGHLVDDAEDGEEKIAKKARLEQLEPMEVVQRYTVDFHNILEKFNFLPPSIEPTATGHIIEQIEIIKVIIAKGYAYEINGSVYFDVVKFNETNDYGKLSGRKLEDMIANTRELAAQDDKRSPQDFALWKKAEPEHIMRWPSPWGDGFPGWNLECTAMSTKYLGETFDIHGGGMDLLFPHHECEIAQSVAAQGEEAVRYWMHNNMVTINGQKMGKSLGNFINLQELFSGEHKLLEKAYSPMTIRFFMLQAHYRSTLDFSNEALQAAEKGFDRMMKAAETLDKIKPSGDKAFDPAKHKAKMLEAMNDDLNSPVVIAQLFDLVKVINSISEGKEQIAAAELNELKEIFNSFVFGILGLQKPECADEKGDLSGELIDMILEIRQEAKKNKDFATADLIRDELKAKGVIVKDKKDGFEWELEG